jgi:hypothetical protein
MNKINRKTFFAEIKSLFPNGYNGRVGKARIQGLDLIIDEWESRGDIEYDEFAYILATVVWETAKTMQPVREYGSDTYLRKKKYWPWIGRGYVQLSWDYNYEKASKKLGIDLMSDPDKAMEPEIAVKILFEGMLEGWFTGKKLSDYMDGLQESDAEDKREFKGARRIINGTDKADQIAAIALKIDRALRKAEIANPYPIHTSRTVQGAVVTGTVATVNLTQQVNDVVSAVESHQEAFSSGQVIGIVIGLIAVLGSLYALYARWDDAGRPKFWN